jgi:DNA polymerase elongation subunit (family B)
MKKPRIVLFDLETSLIKVTTFSLYNDHIPHDAIEQDWFILSWAWKELDSKTTNAASVLDFKRSSLSDDKGLVTAIRKELETVDVIIGHNAQRFDLRKLNARLIYHGLAPLPNIQIVDTLKEVKKVANMTSNRLDYLSKFLGRKGKTHTSPGLWPKCMAGDKKAMAEMVKYNKQDVIELEAVYKKLLPYMKTHPHIGALTGVGRDSCNKCGSTSFEASNKIRYSATGIAKCQKQCKKCHSYSTFPIK